MAANESCQTSEHSKRAPEANANAGGPHGKPSFGYKRLFDADGTSTQVIDEDEVAVVREMFDAYTDATGFRAIANTLNDRGTTTRSGAR